MKISKLMIGASTFGLLAMSQAGAAAIISVNFDLTGDSTPEIAGTAGAAPAANWNNTTTAGGAFVSPATFVDDSNSTVAGFGFTLTGGGTNSWNTIGTTDDQNINGGWADNLTTLDLTGISYAEYDIIVYAGAKWGNDETAITVGTETINLNDTDGGDPLRTPALVEDRDYVRFTGVSGASQSVSFVDNGGGIGVGGFQVVEAVPEPSSTLLIALSGALVAFRRHRA